MMNELHISPIAEKFLQHESSLKCKLFAMFTADLNSVPNFEAYFNVSDSQVSRVGITGFVEYTLQNIICNIFRAFHMVILA